MGVWSHATRSIDTEQKQDVPSIFSTLLATGASSSYSLRKKKKGKSSQEVHPSWAAAKKADFRFGHTFVSASSVTRQRIQLNRHSAHCLPRPTRNFFPKTDNTSEIPRGHLFLPQLPCSTLSLIDSPSLAAIFHLGL